MEKGKHSKTLPGLTSLKSQCISLGNLEMRLALARLIWNFDMKLSPDTDPAWDDQLAFIAFQKKPLIVELRARERSSVKV